MSSPAIATRLPEAQARDDAAFLFGQRFGLDLVDTEPTRHGIRGRRIVAGQHDSVDCEEQRKKIAELMEVVSLVDR